MVVFNGCKINLGLDVLSRREDGFHEIATAMYPVPALSDSIEIVPDDKFRFTSSGLAIDCPQDSNIVLRAARLLGVDNVHIHLHKAIPFGAGLGGGSSDAAATLMLLNRLCNFNLSIAELENLASQLGSDVPFFIRSVPQLCTGRGEIMTPINLSLKGYGLLIVKPSVSISTAASYAGVTPHFPSKSLFERISAPVKEWRDVLPNAFEKSIFVKYPSLAQIKQQLYDMGAVYASMSGSGSAIFGIFERPISNYQSLFPNSFVHFSEL